MIIIGCSHGRHLGNKIAKKLKAAYSGLEAKKFPDGEIKIRFLADVKGKDVALVQSFYCDSDWHINDSIVEAIFAAETAKELGAKRVILVAPYFPYLRQDERFKVGEGVSLKIISGLVDKYFDKIFV